MDQVGVVPYQSFEWGTTIVVRPKDNLGDPLEEGGGKREVEPGFSHTESNEV